jgi:hypothetical protein
MDDINWIGQETEQYKELVYTLLDVTRIFSPSTMEGEMVVYCDTVLRSCGFETHVDQIGNITAVRGNLPKYICLNAHMDTVLSAVPATAERVGAKEYKDTRAPEFYSIKEERDRIYKGIDQSKDRKEMNTMREMVRKLEKRMYRIKEDVSEYAQKCPVVFKFDERYWKPQEIHYFSKSGNVNSTKNYRENLYIGGDDKAGVAIILTLAKLTTHPFKIVLSVREEPPFHGDSRAERPNGVSAVDPTFFSDVNLSITIDKQGSSYLVNKISDIKICDPALIKQIQKVGESCGIKYEVVRGFTCDADKIYKYTNAVNMSCGYYQPHHAGDFIKVPETFATMCVVEKIIGNHNSALYAAL